MKNSPLKVGVIGGGIGRHHLNGYRALGDDVEIVALCDINQKRLDQLADTYNIPLRNTDVYKLLAIGEIDAVSVCLPNHLHAPISIAALEAGLHVLCEKPLAENVLAAEKMVEAVSKASTKFMICFNRRYRPDVQWMKKIVDEGKLGKIYQVRAGWIRETGIPGGWFSDKSMAGGGPLVDLGVHILDSVLWLLGYADPLTVSADVQTNFGPRGAKTWAHRQGIAKEYNVEDSAVAFIRLADHVNLTLETSWASHARPGMDDIYITLLGTEGAIELYVANYAAENTLTFYTEMGGAPVVVQPTVKDNRSDHDRAVAEFVNCIKLDTPPSATAEQGLMVMKIIEAIYESAAQGREVQLGEAVDS